MAALAGLTFLLGGARSGKSDLAVRMASSWAGPVTFVATAEAGDADMADRIDRHRAERPDSWATVEDPLFSAEALAAIDAPGDHDPLVILDCLTLLASNLLLGDRADPEANLEALARACAQRSAPTIVISNEVGLGVVPASELGRTYRDLLGRVNRVFTAEADSALFVIAGATVPLDPWTSS